MPHAFIGANGKYRFSTKKYQIKQRARSRKPKPGARRQKARSRKQKAKSERHEKQKAESGGQEWLAISSRAMQKTESPQKVRNTKKNKKK